MILVFGVIFGVLFSSPTMAENKAELQVMAGNNQFTTNLYKALATENQENVFFSPISVHAVLSMAYQGAQKTTAQAFSSALQVPDAVTASEGYNAIMSRLNNVPNVTLLMANKVYLMDGYQLVEDFNNAITKKFLSDVQLVNFGQSAAAAKTINDWVEEQTREKIKDLIKSDDLDSLTRLVLVNAIYFKGDWKNKFNKELTKTEPFYLNNNDKVDVQMMHIKTKFHYRNNEALDAQILQLPYTNEDLSMIIILPNKKDGIHDLEKKLETYNLSDITKDLWYTEVNVALPRFKVEQSIDLKDSLTKLGLGEIFDEHAANFKGMITADEQLYVSKAIQKAFIEVNEEGAEAAAATAAVFFVRTGRPFVHSMRVDHPFIIQIIYSCCGSRTILFQGRVSNPQN